MVTALNSTGKTLAKRLLLTQTSIVVLVAVGVSLGLSLLHGLGVIAGGLAIIIPTAVFAWRAFAYSGARSAQQIVKSFFAGEALKMVLMTLILAAILGLSGLPNGAVFAGFIVALAVQWLAPVLFLKST
ncbi:MAG: ATP synthase subunit I [Idiomarina sp.]